MNELIKELAIKSGHITGELPLNTNEKINLTGLNKFAELIIKECIGVVEESEGYSQHFPHVVENIEKHFGIE